MRSRIKRGVYSGIGTGILGALACGLPWLLDVEEALGLQSLFRLRGALPPPDEVAVVAIAGASADFYGLSSDLDEWPRSLHARLIERLETAGVVAVIMDIIFESPGNAEHDRALAEAIAQSGKVVLLERVRSEILPVAPASSAVAVHEWRIEPIEIFGAAAWATAPFTLPRVPIRVSQFWTFGRGTSDTPQLPIIALQIRAMPVYGTFVDLLSRHSESGADGLPRTVAEFERTRGLERIARDIRRRFLDEPDLGAQLRASVGTLSMEAEQRRLISALIAAYAGPDSRYLNYYGPTGTIETIPYHEVEQADDAHLRTLDLAGRIVFVGFSERRQAEQQDEFISVYSQPTGLNLSGVEIGATAFANLANLDYAIPLPISLGAVLTFGWGFALAVALAFLTSRQAIVGAGLAAAAYFFAARYAFESASLWLPLVVPLGLVLPGVLAVTLFFNYRTLSLQRERIQVVLGHYMPPQVANRLAHESFDAGASRELVHGTCLVSDAEQFTKIAESLDPEALHALIQQYFEVLGASVERHGGFVADVSGDSMVATWAAAKPDASLRRSACLATLDALREIERFNAASSRPSLPTGIGLDSGELLLGNISIAHRYQYRAVGDIVNTASRIQGLNRQLGTRAIVSAATIESLEDFATRPLGEFVLYGKTNSIFVHEMLGRKRDSTAATEELIAAFHEVLTAFRQRDWPRARVLLHGIMERYPTDGPSLYYLKQCDLLETMTLPPEWSGAIRMTVK